VIGKDKTKIAAAEMTFTRRRAKCTWTGYKRKEDTLKELKIQLHSICLYNTKNRLSKY
jgi:hypothetical protein